MVKKNKDLPITLKPNKRILCFLVASQSLFLVVEIFYLSWLPDGRLGKETHLPLWLLTWSNTYFNLRTAIPFIALSFLLEACHAMGNLTVLNKIKIPFWIFNIAFSSVLVCFAEGGQIFIANRHPDIMDVAYGILGSVLGCILYYLLTIFIRLIFIKNEKPT